MSRLFYPTLFSVTVALAVTLWSRHGLPIGWLSALGAAVAQAQSPAPVDNRPPDGGVSRPPPARPRRLPPVSPTSNAAKRPKAGPLTQLQIDTPSVPPAVESAKPIPIPSARVVARFGNEIVLAADVLPIVKAQFDHMSRGVDPADHERLMQMLMRRAVHEAVQAKIIVAAMKDEIPKDKRPEVEKDILKKFDEFKLPELLKHWKATTEIELDATLKAKGSSLERERFAFIDSCLIGEWIRKEIKFDEYVSPSQLLEYYNEHHADYEYLAKARFEEIRVNYGRQRTKAEALALIRRLAEQIYAGAPLAEVAKAHSDAVSAAKGGLNDWTNEGSIRCAPLNHALFHLPLGVLSQLIDDGRGFVVVRVVERKEAGATSFHDAQGEIKKKILAKREQDARVKRLEDFMAEHMPRAWKYFDDEPELAERPSRTRKKR